MSRWTEQDYAEHLAKKAIKRAKGRAGESRAPLQASVARSHAFTIYGIAQPGGSKQALVPLDKKRECHCGPVAGKLPFRRPNGGIIVSITDANPKAKKWKNYVAKTASQEYSGPQFTGPIAVQFTFYRPRPDSHYGTKGLNKQGRDNPFPATKPDVLKLARALEDALTGICWEDDALIVRETIWKEYGEPARVEVTIEALKVETGQQPLLTADPLRAPAPWEIKTDSNSGNEPSAPPQP